jgi:UDP-glucose 4-epimerase
VILVFGGTGFVGQHVARDLVDRGQRVVISAHSNVAVPALLTDAADAALLEVAPVDITDPFGVMALVAKHRPDVVIDLTGHAPKVLSPGRDVSFRTSALVNILEATRLADVGRVILMSSMDVYWGIPSRQSPYREEFPVPLVEDDDHFIVQSWAKKTLEVIGNLYRRQHGMDIVFARASGIYGPLYRTYMNLPSRLVRAAVGGESELTDGRETPFREGGYDQIYVKDAARALGMIASATHLRHAAYNVGSGGVPLYGAFAEAVRAAVPGCSIDLPVRPSDVEPGAMDGRWMSIERIEQELGFKPTYDIKTAIADYVRWARENQR